MPGRKYEKRFPGVKTKITYLGVIETEQNVQSTSRQCLDYASATTCGIAACHMWHLEACYK